MWSVWQKWRTSSHQIVMHFRFAAIAISVDQSCRKVCRRLKRNTCKQWVCNRLDNTLPYKENVAYDVPKSGTSGCESLLALSFPDMDILVCPLLMADSSDRSTGRSNERSCGYESASECDSYAAEESDFASPEWACNAINNEWIIPDWYLTYQLCFSYIAIVTNFADRSHNWTVTSFPLFATATHSTHIILMLMQMYANITTLTLIM